jgi:hypothetical protein
MEKAGEVLDPVADGIAFGQHVVNVQAAVIHTYQLTAFAAIQMLDPKDAASLWKEMSDLCDDALRVLKGLKGVYAHCGAPALYDLVLDYKTQAHKRYLENLQDSECQSIPAGLFPAMT